MMTLREEQRLSEGDQMAQTEPGTHICTHACMHTQMSMWPSPLRLQKSEETRGQPGEAKGELRSTRRRGHTSQEAGEFPSLVSLSQTLDSSPWTQELTVQ